MAVLLVQTTPGMTGRLTVVNASARPPVNRMNLSPATKLVLPKKVTVSVPPREIVPVATSLSQLKVALVLAISIRVAPRSVTLAPTVMVPMELPGEIVELAGE